MYVGLHTASLPQVLAEARQRIVLHMALYAEFGRMPALAEALRLRRAGAGWTNSCTPCART